jgi:hypothetical protein
MNAAGDVAPRKDIPMSITGSQAEHLKKLHSAYTSDGYTFTNPKQPLTGSLITSGHLTADHETVDPSNSGKVAVWLSGSGLDAIGVAPVAGAGATITTAQAAPVAPLAGVPATPAAAEAVEAVKPKRTGKTGPRAVPVIVPSTGRMAMPSHAMAKKGTRGETYPFSSLAAPDGSTDAEGQMLYDHFFVTATSEMPNPGKSLAGTVNSANKRMKDAGAVFKLVPMGVDGAAVFRIK